MAVAIVIFLVFVLAALLFIGEYFFRFIVCRKQWGLPSLVSSHLVGSEEDEAQDTYSREAQARAANLEAGSMEKLTIDSRDGLCLRGRLWRTDAAESPILLCVHGCRSRGCLEFAYSAAELHNAGLQLLLIDQRACGASEGVYMTYGQKEAEDVLLWIEKLKELYESPKIWLYGVSMGAATVLCAAAQSTCVRGVIADCSYTGAWEEFRYQLNTSFHLPAFPLLHLTNLLSRLHCGFNFKEASPLRAIAKIKIPVLLIHGTGDDFVPAEMETTLFNHANEPKQQLLVNGALHAQSYHTDPTAYLNTMVGFIRR